MAPGRSVVVRKRGKSAARKGGVAPDRDPYEVTLFPTAVSTSPAPAAAWTNSTNILTDDGSEATCTVAAGAGASHSLHLEGFGFQDVLPSDADITQVRIVFEVRRVGGVQDSDRAQVMPRCLDEPSGLSWRPVFPTASTVEYTVDVTSDPASTPLWSSSEWTRDLLHDNNFKVGVRSNRIGDTGTTQHWDEVHVIVNYIGSPPNTPVQVRYPLTVGTVGNGSGSVTGPGLNTSGGDVTIQVPAGTVMPLTASAASGSVWGGWEGNVPAGQTLANPLQLIVDQEKSVDARFTVASGGDPVESHWGTVIAEDLATNSSAIQVWQQQSTPWYSSQHVSESGDPNADPYVQRIAGTGTWIPHGKASPSTHFRRLITPVAPPQAIYDSHVAGKHWPDDTNATTRCQLQRWSSQSAFWIGRNGDRVWITLGFRVMANPPLSRDLAAGGGNNDFTQIIQFKARNGSGYSEVDSVSAGRNGFKFNIGPHPGTTEFYDPVPCPHGVWHRLAIEQLISTNSAVGYFTPWVKLNGQSSWQQVGPKRFLRNIPDNGYRNMGLGPYHDIRLCTNNRLYQCDYRDIQIIRYV